MPSAFNTMNEQEPQWMIDHKASDQENFDDIRNALQRIEIKLDPIYNNYETATHMGKWFMATATVVSIVIGILMGVKALLGK